MKSLDPEGRRLIDEVLEADVPGGAVEARIWKSLSGKLVGPLPPTAAGAQTALQAHGSSALFSVFGAKVAVGVSVGLFVAGTTWFALHAVQAPAQNRPVPTIAAPSGREPSSVTTMPPSAASDLAAMPAKPSASGQGLVLETRLLAEAMRALRAGDPATALASLEEHRTRFPTGALAQERDVASVLALCALGRRDEAEQKRRRFLKSWPSSPHAARLRAACTERVGSAR